VPAGRAGRPPGRPGPQGRVAALPLPLLDLPAGGELLRAPWSEEIGGFDETAFGLHPVGVATWGGFVFLHLTPAEAAPLADQLGPVPDRLRRYPLEALAVGRRLAYRVAANWKLIAENDNDCYQAFARGLRPSGRR
jgi:phenylpropionate dioxygenase-like ring-hydroxylating dioxygenase large terminal subunit